MPKRRRFHVSREFHELLTKDGSWAVYDRDGRDAETPIAVFASRLDANWFCGHKEDGDGDEWRARALAAEALVAELTDAARELVDAMDADIDRDDNYWRPVFAAKRVLRRKLGDDQ